MKVKCIKSYIDKNTKKVVKVGDVFEVDDKRFNEIKKYVEEVTAKPKAKAEE